MRTIKFRIWDKSIKKWMFGYEILGGFSLIGEITLMGELSRISLKKLSNDDYAVMQYTGLKDKNGKEIYEGDVLEIDNDSPPLVVGWGNKFASFVLDKYGWASSHYFMEGCDNKDSQVIGNIHENPELL